MSSNKAGLLTACLLVGACARSSPELPPDMSSRPAEQRVLASDNVSPEGKLDCAELAVELERNRTTASQLEQKIAANRGHNQAVGYIGAALFPPVLLAAKSDDDAKKTLDRLQEQRDRIDRLTKAKKCGPAS